MSILTRFSIDCFTRPSSHSRGVDGEPPSIRRRSRSPESSQGEKLDRGVVVIQSNNVNDSVTVEKERNNAHEKEKEKDAALRAEFAKLLKTRSGGVYMPPARLRAMQEAASTDKSSVEYQRLSWDALRKSITGIVNRVNVANIKLIVPELLSENLIRGRGLFARSVMKAQAASLPFTPVFASLVAIINTKLPQVGELVVIRLISQFRRAFKRNDKVFYSYDFSSLWPKLCEIRLYATPPQPFLPISSTKQSRMKSLSFKYWYFSSNDLQMILLKLLSD